MKVLNDLVISAATRRVAELRRQRADRITVWVSVGATVVLILLTIVGTI